MSISAALSNALTGLTAVSRGTEVVSSNIANILTPGYAARELQLSPHIYSGNGGGVKVEGIQRLVPNSVVADNRQAQANLGKSSTLAAFHVAMETATGTADQDHSLTAILTNFEASLINAAASPDSNARLQIAVDAAKDVSNKINFIAMELQKARTVADKAIESDVNRLNSALAEVARLNRLVTIAKARGQDTSSLVDARQATIDAISDIVPLQEVQRDNGIVSLFTKGGATLLDGLKPAEIKFLASGVVTPQKSVSDGNLSGVTLDGVELTTSQMNMFRGGTLEANFSIRDNHGPEYQNQLDRFAYDLYNRLSDPSVDPSVSQDLPGIFSDLQNAITPTTTLGFANRISLNRAVDYTLGGDAWRLRDGIYATQPGNSGNNTLIEAIRASISANSTAANVGSQQSNKSIFTRASELSSLISANRINAKSLEKIHETHDQSAKSNLLSYGVDSDKEMEILLQLEKSYAANAKVIQAANEMIDSILRIS
ncbi:flagellar hook-associated protein FlgK [Paracoccus sp. (in: a-proteobacteria)]|uniref:flagellar hook-associated protein FlgK n=1 Tax=Paracoccus sp. TaxID=267 RepID=UPI0028A200FB|nr:flagellar hook-associated protein FlgK [Paracoccus sp. (in: a-proteobacteria)]